MAENLRGWKKSCTFAPGFENRGVFQSGQMGQTVNLLSFDFGGSNPSAPTQNRIGYDDSYPIFLCFRNNSVKKCKKDVFPHTIVLCSHTMA